MKKHIACCLASIVILSLITGCGGNNTADPKDSSAATEADSGNGSAEAADTILIGRQKDPTDLDPTSGNDYESTRMYVSGCTYGSVCLYIRMYCVSSSTATCTKMHCILYQDSP